MKRFCGVRCVRLRRSRAACAATSNEALSSAGSGAVGSLRGTMTVTGVCRVRGKRHDAVMATTQGRGRRRSVGPVRVRLSGGWPTARGRERRSGAHRAGGAVPACDSAPSHGRSPVGACGRARGHRRVSPQQARSGSDRYRRALPASRRHCPTTGVPRSAEREAAANHPLGAAAPGCRCIRRKSARVRTRRPGRSRHWPCPARTAQCHLDSRRPRPHPPPYGKGPGR